MIAQAKNVRWLLYLILTAYFLLVTVALFGETIAGYFEEDYCEKPDEFFYRAQQNYDSWARER